LRLSGARKGVRCSRGLGHAFTLAPQVIDFGVSILENRTETGPLEIQNCREKEERA
jgi:hypothetical protein